MEIQVRPPYLDGRLVDDSLVVKRGDGYVPLSDAGLLGGVGRAVVEPPLVAVRAIVALLPAVL